MLVLAKTSGAESNLGHQFRNLNCQRKICRFDDTPYSIYPDFRFTY
jgi:hypothetical protein